MKDSAEQVIQYGQYTQTGFPSTQQRLVRTSHHAALSYLDSGVGPPAGAERERWYGRPTQPLIIVCSNNPGSLSKSWDKVHTGTSFRPKPPPFLVPAQWPLRSGTGERQTSHELTLRCVSSARHQQTGETCAVKKVTNVFTKKVGHVSAAYPAQSCAHTKHLSSGFN